MPTLFLAFLFALATSIGTAAVLDLLNIPKEVAISISAAILAFVPQFKDALEKRANGLEPSSTLMRYGDERLHPLTIVFQGSLGFFAVLFFSSFVAGVSLRTFAGGDRLLRNELLGPLVVLSGISINLPCAFLFGRWTGRKQIKWGSVSLVVSFYIARICATIADRILYVNDEAYRAVYGDASWTDVLTQGLIGATLFAIVGMLGYWRGTHQRVSTYMVRLLNRLPQATQIAMLDIAYEEVKSMLNAKNRKS